MIFNLFFILFVFLNWKFEFIKSEEEVSCEMVTKRAAGFLIFKRVNDDILYLLLKARLVIKFNGLN